ncbi:hypothetical protein JCM11957_04290 [Caminibacter profundus]
MINKLLDKIKKLEEEIEHIKNKNQIIKNNLIVLFKDCKIEKNKKNDFIEKLMKNLNALEIENCESFFTKNYISPNNFFELIEGEKYVIFIIVDSDKKEYVTSFLIKKFSPFFTIYKEKIIGVIEKKVLDDLKSVKSIPFFNPQTLEYEDIEIYKAIFLTDKFSFNNLHKIFELFDSFRNRPSLMKKHFIIYDLDKEKFIDFEKEKIEKEKSKYSYIYEETYPVLEIKLKRERNNIPFIFAMLERIDKEIDEIKKSRGSINVVNRILNFIELQVNEKEIKKIIKTLRKQLKE